MSEQIWNVQSLKYYIESLLTEKDKALAAALVAVKEENRKTELGAEKRFDLLNELRDGVATKEQLEALEKIVAELNNRLNRSEGQTTGGQVTTGKLYAAIAAVGTIIGILVLVANGVFQ